MLQLSRNLLVTTLRTSILAAIAITPAVGIQKHADAAEQTSTQAISKNAEIEAAIQKHIDRGDVSGAVALVVGKDGPLHLSASGRSDIESNRDTKIDDIYWIASMSKPVTGVAVMILVDQGKLSLDEPISTYLPEMKDLKLEDGTPATISLRHLMTHTSGMKELPGGEAYSSKNLKEAAAKYAKLPVSFAPGSKWQYSQTSINTAARIVEVVSGLPFEKFLDEQIFQPLGMKDTGFYLSDSQVKRLASSYEVTPEKSFKKTRVWLLGDKSPTDKDRMPAANGGLFSTAEDYGKFCRMLLNRGELNGKRILSEESVTIFSTPAIHDLQTGFTPGNTWGIGCCIVKSPQGVTKDLSPGSYGHGGAFGTQAWIDPTKNIAYILMVQRSNFPNADASELRGAFQEKAAAIFGQ